MPLVSEAICYVEFFKLCIHHINLNYSSEEAIKSFEWDSSVFVCCFAEGLECFVKCLDSPRIQLACAHLFGQLFTTLEIEFFHSLTDPSVKQLTEWMCWQLKTRLLKEDLAEQVSSTFILLFCLKNFVL